MSRLFFALLVVLTQCAIAPAWARPASAAPSIPSCSWNAPGHHAFTGDVVAAVDRYQDIPAPVRAKLKQRMADRNYDELVRIRRDSIVGRQAYGADIREMYFGSGQVCATVDRSGWSAQAEERGLVYCESGHCILVPTVCRNVSRISVLSAAAAAPTAAAPAGGGGGGGGAEPEQSAGSGVAAAPEGDAAGLPQAQVRGVAGETDGLGLGSGPSAAATWQELAGPASPQGSSAMPGQSPSLPPVPLRQALGGGDFPSSPLPGPLPLPVPEPASQLLMFAGLLGLGLVVARRRRA